MLQGGPHNHQIAALAVALREASTPKFVTYARNVIYNAWALGKGLIRRGYHLVTGGTDNHIVLWDVWSVIAFGGTPMTGSKVERVLEMAGIISIVENEQPLNKDSCRTKGGTNLSELDTLLGKVIESVVKQSGAVSL
jgi:glycine/serine hydroxymethyltransferase